MGKCTKCGKELSFLEKHKTGGSDMASFLNALKSGRFPEYSGKDVCTSCMRELLNRDANQLENEVKIGRFCVNCTFYYKILNGIDALRLSQNVSFFPTHYCKKLELKLENPYEGNEAEKCTSYLSPKEYKEKALSGELNRAKANIQIILDFSSLKDVMSKGGLVMTTYKCPNCNGMVNIPEAGKVLMCQYCGTPIKPIDIFDKIKSLMQSSETVTENPKEVESKPEKQEEESKPDWYKEALKQHTVE